MKLFLPAYLLVACCWLFVAQLGRLSNIWQGNMFSTGLRVVGSSLGIAFAVFCVWGAFRSYKSLNRNLELHQIDTNLLFRLLNPLGRVFPRKFRHEVFENSVNDLLLDLDEDRRAQLDLVWLHLTLIVKIGFLICGTLMAALEEVSGLYSLLALISKFLGK